MHLTPSERDRLLIFTVAELARARQARGLLLNVPEATAIVADTVAEAARDGLRVDAARELGRTALRSDEVLPGVADVVREVAVEAVFDDGTRLVVVPEPFGPAGTETTSPGRIYRAAGAAPPPAAPGPTVTLAVVNEATVPISVTSHLHFFEVNPRLRFDRSAAWGMHLAVPAGQVVRFEPAVPVDVGLRPIGGERIVIGFAGLVDGPLDAPGAREAGLARARATGYLGADEHP